MTESIGAIIRRKREERGWNRNQLGQIIGAHDGRIVRTWEDGICLPSWVSVHLCRHIHAQPFVRSQRNDRQSDYDRNKAPQDSPVTMIWDMNAEELMTIANKRLCSQASQETQMVVRAMCLAVLDKCPEFEGLLVPVCQYHGGVCHEMNPCFKANQSEVT